MTTNATVSAAVRWGHAPALVLGIDGTAFWLLARGASAVWLVPLLLVAIAASFAAERVLPYEPRWNRAHDDVRRDWLHAAVNEALGAIMVACTPLVPAVLCGGKGWWPHGWPFALQVAGAILLFDLGITLAHRASHRWPLLWRFHAVHHAVRRMYGLNGLMKHPVHQLIETGAGALPLVALGMPVRVAAALGVATAVQLLLQHSNVDYRLGALERLVAGNVVHRSHHLASAADGDVNFGLFTTLWDRLFGTFRADARDRVGAGAIGVADRPGFPDAWLAQMCEPFRRRRAA